MAFRFGTGAAGTTLSGNATVYCKSLWTDAPAFPGQAAAQRTAIK